MDRWTPRTRYEEISPERCWPLLESQQVGRLVWNGQEGLSVATMNYAVDDLTVLLRTLPYGTVARECDDRPVAFHVDHAEPTTRTGWSVLVRGRAFFDDEDEIPREAVDVWPDGSRVLRLRVVPRQVTGRRLVLVGADRRPALLA